MRAIRNCLPSPAMVVACAALVIALGGVSYAAAVLPKTRSVPPSFKRRRLRPRSCKRTPSAGPR